MQSSTFEPGLSARSNAVIWTEGEGEGLLSDLKYGGWGLSPFIESLLFGKPWGGEL